MKLRYTRAFVRKTADMSSMDGAVSWRQQYLDAMSSGLERLLTSGHFSDTTVIAGSYSLKCHKAVLAAISPYFEAMFTSGMKESLTGVVKIEGIDNNVFKDILSYIYCGFDIVTDANAEEVCSKTVTRASLVFQA